jgi:hypothetical protein
MEWTITLNNDQGYAGIVTNGIADKVGSLAMVKEINKTLENTTIKKILVDHRNITKVTGEVVDVYNRPKELEAIGVPKSVKIAEVIKPEHREFFYFLETVCINRGFSFSIFEDEKSALEWLLK